MFNYKCLKVVLKKRIEKTNYSGSRKEITDVPVTTFGHYDCMKFEVVDNWHEFRPIHSDKVGDTLLTDYTIRMLYPHDQIAMIRDEYPAMNYDIWEILAKSKNNKNREIFLSSPFIACCLINLSDSFFIFKKKQGNFDLSAYVNYVLEEIGKKIREKINGQNNLKYAVYFGLGYTDLIILFNSNSLRQIASCINAVRDITYSENNALISTTYTISGVVQCNQYNIPKEETVGVSFDFSRMPNTSIEELKSDIDELDKNVALYSIFGSYEWRAVVYEKALTELAELYKFNTHDGKLVSSDNLKSQLTRLHFEKNIKELNGIVKVSKPSNEKWTYLTDQLEKVFEEFDNNFEILFKNNYIHRRTRNALWQIRLIFNKVIATTHGYEVGVLVGRFFINYLNTLNLFIYIINGETKKFTNKFDNLIGDELEKYKKYIDWVDEENDNMNLERLEEVIFSTYKYRLTKFIEEEVELFRSKISFLLFDIWRSDQPFFEGQTIAHPSVGSTTKLLFAYNYMINEWDTLGRKNNNIGSSTRYSFLVTSGGGDETICKKLFSGLAFVRSSRIRPAVITMPEASLYDIKGSLIRLAHEYFHLRGKRLRKERAKYYFNDLCDIVAESIASSANSWYISEYKAEYEKKYKKKINKEELVSVLDKIYPKVGEKVQDLRVKIREKLSSYFSEMNLPEDEKDEIYYSQKIQKECFESLRNFLKEQDKLFEIAELLQEYFLSTYRPIRNIFDSNADEVAFIEADFVFDENNKPALNELIRQLIEKNILLKFFSPNRKVANRYQIINMEMAYEQLGVYQECYPDCLAIKSIGAEFHEYVFALLFENRNIYDFFETIVENNEIKEVGKFIIWRFGIVRDICFTGQEIAITEEQAKNFYDILYPDLINVKDVEINKGKFVRDLIKAMAVINDSYNKMTAKGKELYPNNLKEYLKQCIKINDSLCKTIRESIYGKNTVLKGNDNVELYSLLMEKWLNIYET